MATIIRLTSMPQDTNFAPLGVLGYCLTRTDFLAPVFADLTLPIKEVDHPPVAKLMDALASILAGCRAISQVNTRIRPDLALARAWGRERFAEQSNVARTLDAFSLEHIAQLRQGGEVLFRRESRTLQHDFAQDWLWLDIDLTPLPASKHAEGSTKGKIGGKKTDMDANWHELTPHSTKRPCSHVYTRVSSTAAPHTYPHSRRWVNSWDSARPRNNAPSCAPTLALAATTTSTMP
jgi:hypothetical protein